MVLAFWPITALFFDALGHNNRTGQESFFTLAHLFLYAGLVALSLWVGMLVTRYQLAAGVDPKKLLPDLKQIPVGYGVTILGFCVLGVAGPADLIWHSIYGFEINVAAVYSPPHLCLFFGGMLVASTGIRSMWAKGDIAPDFKTYLPVLLSSILFVAMAGFITMYLSAFMTNVSPTSAFVNDLKHFHDVHDDQSISLNAGLTGYGDNLWPYLYYSVSHGIASMVITTIVLLGPMLLNARRWRMPFGAATLTFLGYGVLMSIMTEYRDAVLIIPLVLTGVAMDLLVQRLGNTRADRRVSLGGIRILGTATGAVLWFSYYAVLALDKGIGWKPTLWTGALIVAVMSGFGLAFLIAPPAYGPRLVEAEDVPA